MNINNDVGICIFCDFPIYKNQEVFYLGLDRPMRIDLPVHRSCWKLHRNNEDIKAFLNDNLFDYLEKYGEEENGKKKKKDYRSKTRK